MSGVVVEGPDGSGKTELIKRIQHGKKWPMVHVVQPSTPDVRQMLDLASCEPVLFDRYHWSPVVYGKVLRKGPELSDYDLWALEGHLINRGFVLVVCLTDGATMVENNLKEDQLWDEVRRMEVVGHLRDAYLHLMVSTDMPVKLFNYKRQADHQDTFDFIEQHTTAPGPVDTLGHVKPDIWFVGDERKDLSGKGLSIPFYDTGIADKLLSGTLLYRALRDNHYTWRNKVALSNSAERPLRCDYERLGEPRVVVALGKVAYNRLKDTGIDARTVHHPQYWRRFQHHNPDGYIKQLKEAVER